MATKEAPEAPKNANLFFYFLVQFRHFCRTGTIPNSLPLLTIAATVGASRACSTAAAFSTGAAQ
jgi:hypothetical protein